MSRQRGKPVVVPPAPRPRGKAVTKRHPGQPTKFRKEFCGQARKLCLLGATDVELAEFFGVSKRAVDLWKVKHREFLHSITRGREVADAEVAEKLYQRALGYTHPEEKIFCNAAGKVTRANTLQHYPPCERSASLWLRNRQPARWRDRPNPDQGLQVIINTDLRPRLGARAPGHYTIDLTPEDDDVPAIGPGERPNGK